MVVAAPPDPRWRLARLRLAIHIAQFYQRALDRQAVEIRRWL